MSDAVLPNPVPMGRSLRWIIWPLVVVAVLVALIASGVIQLPGLGFGSRSLQLLMKDARGDDSDRKIAALLQLGEHPEYLPESLPVMLEALIDKDELVRGAAGIAVDSCSEQIVPLLGPWVESNELQKFGVGAEAVRVIGVPASQWTDAVIQGLHHEQTQFRMAALFGLQGVGPSAIKALDRLIELLDDTEFNIVINACRVLANLGPAANKASPKLMTKLADDGTNILSVRSTAAETLGALGPVEGIDLVGALTAKLDVFYQLEKERALIGLGKLGSAAMPAIPKIKALMGDSDDPLDQTSRAVMPRAALTYYQITGDAATAVRILRSLLDSPTYEIEAIARIGDMGQHGQSLVPELIAKLSSEEPYTREQTVLTLAAMGPSAAEAKKRLTFVANNDEDDLIRYAAKRALKEIAP